MLRIDWAAAGIEYVVMGPAGEEYRDFHALRHSFLTLGGRSGIGLRTLQELAGHSTPILTARYSHRRHYDLTGAIEKVPKLVPRDISPNASENSPSPDGRQCGANWRSVRSNAGHSTAFRCAIVHY